MAETSKSYSVKCGGQSIHTIHADGFHVTGNGELIVYDIDGVLRAAFAPGRWTRVFAKGGEVEEGSTTSIRSGDQRPPR